MELPFEHDSAELIEVCMEALQAVEVYAAAAAPHPGTRIEEHRSASETVIRTQTGDMQTAGAPPEAPEQAFFWDLPLPSDTLPDAEALSLAFERDARRFEAT